MSNEKKNFALPSMNMKMNLSSSGRSASFAERNDVDVDYKEVKKTSFNIPMDIYRNLRKLAALEDRHLGDIVEEAFLDVLKKYGM